MSAATRSAAAPTRSSTPQFFSTCDTAVASYLVALGHQLRGIEGTPGQREFLFDSGAQSDAALYFTTQKPVAPSSLFGAYRTLMKAISVR
jgi:hypothetical protein